MRNLIALLLFSVFSFGQRTLPPGTVLDKTNITITEDNFITSWHYWPFNWYAEGSNPPYGVTPSDHRTENPQGSPHTEILTPQYYEAGWVRQFYPDGEALYDTTLGLSENTLRWLLEEADFHHSNGKKMIWTGGCFSGSGQEWGTETNSVAREQALLDYWTALFTSTYTNPGGLGFTFATHPAIAVIEPANEQINASVANTYADSYARMMRIIKKLIEQYKPACRLITFCAQGGNGIAFGQILKGNAASIIPATVNGDDGTGKTAADYLDIVSWHFYEESVETVSGYEADKANNAFVSRSNLHLFENHMKNTINAEIYFNPSSPLYGTNYSDITIWNTESGVAPAEGAPASVGGLRWWNFGEEEAFNNMLRWAVPSLFATSDGAGGLGLFAPYKADINGIFYGNTSETYGNSGTISDIEEGSIGIRFRTSDQPNAIGWIENMRIVITAPAGGWSDLGLLAGEKKRYVVHVVDAETNTLELKGTNFTSAPTGTINYSEFQVSQSPFPEEYIKLIELLKSGPCSFGYRYDSNGMYQGFTLVVEGQGVWYSDKDGSVKKW